MVDAQVTLLGRFEVCIDGRPVEISSSKERALVVRLALAAGGVVATDHLIEAIWPEERPDDPGRALRYRIWHVRNLLEPHRADRSEGTLLLTRPTGYVLAVDPAAVDAVRLESAWEQGRFANSDDVHARRDGLASMLEAWRPARFAEGASQGPLAEAAVRLDRIRSLLMVDRIAADLALGRDAELVPELQQLIVDQPFDERLRGHLMMALYRAGRQADALAVYASTRDLLVGELGVEPGPELHALERRILQHDDDLRGHPRPGGVTPATGSDVVAGDVLGLPVPELIGRREELDALIASLADVTARSRLASVVIVGEAGVGKTSLLRAFADAAAATALVVQGRCDEAVSVPLQPFRTIVDRLVSGADQRTLVSHAESHAHILALIAPAFARRIGPHGALGANDATDRFLLFQAVTDMVRCVALGRPLVLLLDDVHWAEPTALQLMRHLVRAAPDAPVLVVVSTRDPDDSASPELRAALADLARSPSVRIELGGLDRSQLADLVCSMSRPSGTDDPRDPAMVDPDVVETLDADTAGNPLFATHLVRHWLDTARIDTSGPTIRFAATATAVPLPATLRDIVWARLRALGPDAPGVLSAAAVLGDDISESSLIELADASADVVATVLDAATRAGIVTEVAGRAGAVRFTHALVASAAEADLPTPKRRRLHERAARSLERSGGRSASTLTRIAHHWDRAASSPDALRSALDAGNAALLSLAAAEAVHWFRRALAHADALGSTDAERAAVLVQLGKGLQRTGDATALDTLMQAAELARRSGDHHTLVQAAEATGRGFIRLGDFAPTYLGLVEQALEVTPPEDATTRARLLAMLGAALRASSDTERREQAALDALALADASDDPLLLAELAPDILRALWTPATAALRADISACAVRAVAASGDPYLRFVVNLSAFNTAVSLGDASQAKTALASAHEVVRTHSEPRMRWTLCVTDTFNMTMAGRFHEAEQLANANLELGMTLSEADAFSIFASQFFVLGTFAGRYGDILPVVDHVLAAGETALPFRLAHAISCAVCGRRDEAAAVLQAGHAAGFASVPQDQLWLTTVVGYAVLAIELDDRVAAAELVPVLEPCARQVAFNGATSQGPVAAYLGRLASMLGRHDDADRHLHAALATTEAFGWEYHRASTLICLAESRLRRSGGMDAIVRQLLDDAQEICAAHGIGWWADRIRTLRGLAVTE